MKLEEIDVDALIDLTAQLVGEASENPPGAEAGVASVLADRLNRSAVDFDIEISEVMTDRPNVFARAGDPEKGSVLLTGHTDVVPANKSDWPSDPYRLQKVDGRLVGRGTADMKGALSAKLLAAEAYLEATEDPGEVMLAFVVDEEHEGSGTRALIDRGINADAAIIGEPTQLQACIAQKGVARYRITVEGESSHSGTPDEGVDAIRAAGRFLRAFERLDDTLRRERQHDLLKPETVTVTEIEGGSAPNVVADRVSFTLDWRFHPGRPTVPNPFDERVEQVLESTDTGHEINMTMARTVFARAASVPADHQLAGTVVEAAADAGIRSGRVGLNAATDARFLIHDADIPTVLFGPGSIKADAHTVGESVAVDDLLKTAQVYRNITERLLD